MNKFNTVPIEDVLYSHISHKSHFLSRKDAIIRAKLAPIKYRKTKNFIEYEKIMSAFKYIPYFEDPDCPRYKIYIREYLESIFDIERLPYKGAYRKKLVDFIMSLDGKKLKVKHLVSCMCDSSIGAFWKYIIEHNKEADAFLLMAFNDREYLELQHMWLIESDQIFKIKRTMKPFRDRETLTIHSHKDVIDYMNKFELKEKLEQLKIVMKMGYHKPNDEHKSFARLLLFKKQRQILDTTGIKRNIINIAEDAIERGLGPKEISIENVVLKTKKRMLRIVEGEREGQPREECENDAYNLIIEKQKEIFDMTGNMRTIKDIIDAAIELGIDRRIIEK